MELKGKSCPAWVLPNSGENGYYRVAYRGDLLTRLLDKGREKLSTAEKVGVLGDIRASVRTGDLPAAAALKVVPDFAADPSSEVVSNAMGIVGLMPEDEIPAELVAKRAAYIRSIFGARAEKLGWTPKGGESDDDQLMRQSVVPFVANEGQDEALIREAGRLAHEWLESRKGIDPNILGPVFRRAASLATGVRSMRFSRRRKRSRIPASVKR